MQFPKEGYAAYSEKLEKHLILAGYPDIKKKWNENYNSWPTPGIIAWYWDNGSEKPAAKPYGYQRLSSSEESWPIIKNILEIIDNQSITPLIFN